MNMSQDLKFTQDKFIKNLARLEYLTNLTGSHNSQITECIQYISEALVWSEQNKQMYFNQFKFNNTQQIFTKILRDLRSKDLTIQLIQSANIFIHNFSIAENKAYLLSSEFFLALVSFDFDFSDDEITENYISFIKGISANLTSDLLLNYVIHTRFLLFTQAFKFFFHPDAMLRNASRTTILTIIKSKIQSARNPTVFSFLTDFEFVPKILKKILDIWNRLYTEQTLERSQFELLLSSIPEDLLYLNDLMDHVKELSKEISVSFISQSAPWITQKISAVLELGESFSPVGWVMNCILDSIKSSSVLDVLVSALFADKISEKVKGYMLREAVQNNWLDYFTEESKEVDNAVKHQVISLLNEPYSATALLLLINKVISNPFVRKKTLYECALLPKEEIKTQILLRRVLQDKVEYVTNPLVSEFLLQIFLGEQSSFNVFLAGRIVSICQLYPQEKYMLVFQNDLNTQIILIVSHLLELLSTEKLQDLALEAFEKENEAVKKMKIDEKIEYPVEILLNIKHMIPLPYRLPISKKEIYHWNFSRLLLLTVFENIIFDADKVRDPFTEESDKSESLSIECSNDVSLFLDDFSIKICKKNCEKVVKLRNIEVMLDNREPNSLSLISNDAKDHLNETIRFSDTDLCKESKKMIEIKRKGSKNKKMMMIKDYLSSEKARRTAFSNSFR